VSGALEGALGLAALAEQRELAEFVLQVVHRVAPALLQLRDWTVGHNSDVVRAPGASFNRLFVGKRGATSARRLQRLQRLNILACLPVDFSTYLQAYDTETRHHRNTSQVQAMSPGLPLESLDFELSIPSCIQYVR
jgi:hypothetical protein